VALAIDMTGHGYSAPPALANTFGGPDGLQYLLSRDYVDKNNIGLEGHSMGGWAIVQTAKAFPNNYKALAMEDSNFATITNTFPRNLCFVVAKCGEFSQSWWGVPEAKNVGTSAAIKRAFGVSEDVVPGKLYGSIADGTARELFLIPTTHPGIHISTQAIGDTVAWFQATLQGGNDLSPSNQTWLWKEIGNLIALIGMFLLFFPVGSLLMRTSFFKTIEEAPAEKPKSAKGVAWWISALIIVVVPPLTYLTFVEFATKFKLAPNQLFPQTFTAQFMIWLLLVGVIGLVLFLIWHFAFNRKAKASAADYGLTWGSPIGWSKIGKSFLLGFIVVLAGYVTLVLSWWLFNVDFRFWVFNIKPMDLIEFRVFLSYLIPFFVFFVILGLVLNGQLRPTRKGTEMNLGSEMVINVVLLVLGFVGFLLYQYIPLLTGGTLSIGKSSDHILFTIMAFQLLPIFTIVALAYTYFFRKTAHIYAGVFLAALLVTWILVASQPIFVAM
jgi:hypothetical protein